MKHDGGQPLNRHTLELWTRSPRGRRLLALEEREVKRVLPELFGRHLLQVGSWGRGDQMLAASEMLHKAVLGTVPNWDAQAQAEPERLPVADKSVDALLLAHTLEFARSPKSVLRESNRILTDRGRLLLLGFNPWSTWALRRSLGFRYRAFPAGARFVSVGRLYDWLELLDFEVIEVRRFGVGFPWMQPSTADDAFSPAHWLSALSEGYLVVAKKRVVPLTLIGRVQRAAITPLIGGVSAPGAHTRNPTRNPT